MLKTARNYLTLNTNQHRILKLFYKFRFISVPLLQEYLGHKDHSTTRRTINTLVEQQYISKIYDKSYHQLNKPAVYCLDKRGINLLRQNQELDTGVLHSYYKNKILEEKTKQHALDVLAFYNSLKMDNPSLLMFTKSELAGYDDFSITKPDLYIRNSNSGTEYFIMLLHDEQPFIARKRVNELVDHSEDVGWPTGAYPTLLLVVKNEAHESKLHDYISQTLESAGISHQELQVSVTTFDKFLRSHLYC